MRRRSTYDHDKDCVLPNLNIPRARGHMEDSNGKINFELWQLLIRLDISSLD